MTGRNAQLIKTVPPSQGSDELRLFPFIIAGIICFAIAVVLGVGSWFFYNSVRRQNQNTAAETPLIAAESEKTPAVATPVPTENVVGDEQANASVPEEKVSVDKSAIENVVEVGGGEIVIGGDETNKPLQRQIVADFLIAETEVTNAQYAEFIKETNHPAPLGWNKAKFPDGTENFPVTNVSWRDAVAFCEWMSKKTGLPVRLPTEAEWELAARGREGYKYPWGSEWNKDALATRENGGKVSAVKSFPANRSPFGAFDMAGNVWEWTQNKVEKDEAVTDEYVKEALASGQILRVVKGGSAGEKSEQISARARYEIPERTKDSMVGFRYVLEKR